jgi:hypothetical protein
MAGNVKNWRLFLWQNKHGENGKKKYSISNENIEKNEVKVKEIGSFLWYFLAHPVAVWQGLVNYYWVIVFIVFPSPRGNLGKTLCQKSD